MPAKYGVNYTISTEVARPIPVKSITPLGIVGTLEGFESGLYFFGSVSEAKEVAKNKKGTLKKAIDAVFDQSVETPVILSIFASKAGSKSKDEKNANDTPDKSLAINAVELLCKAEAITAYKPDIIIAPYFSEDADIAAKMQAVAEKLKATAIIDLGVDDESAAILKAKNYGSKRVVLCNPYVSIWDTLEDKSVNVPLSPYIAGLICRTDAEREYGFSDSPSNRVISGISGVARPIDFVLGEDSEADRLRSAGIATVIRYSGFRLWGAETTDIDPIWSDLPRVRTFDRIAQACQKGVFYAVDKKASQLYHAKRSVEELCRNLTGSGVLIGYEVSWNKAKNTTTTVTAGKFYLDIKIQNNPIVKTIELDFAYVDKYSDKLLADINN